MSHQQKSIALRLRFDHQDKPYLLDFTQLLHDFELLYDQVIWTQTLRYDLVDFKVRPSWHKIRREFRLRVGKIRKESPLVIDLLIPWVVGFSSVIALIKTILSIETWRVDRETTQLEIRKLQREEDEYLAEKDRESVERSINEADAADRLEKLIANLQKEPVVRRIESHPSKLEALEVQSEHLKTRPS